MALKEVSGPGGSFLEDSRGNRINLESFGPDGVIDASALPVVSPFTKVTGTVDLQSSGGDGNTIDFGGLGPFQLLFVKAEVTEDLVKTAGQNNFYKYVFSINTQVTQSVGSARVLTEDRSAIGAKFNILGAGTDGGDQVSLPWICLRNSTNVILTVSTVDNGGSAVLMDAGKLALTCYVLDLE